MTDYIFSLTVDGIDKAHARHDDNTEGQNSISLNRIMHLNAGQRIGCNPHQMNSVYGSHNGNLGFNSWFTGFLIYAD